MPMLQPYAPNEFYADRISHRLAIAKRRWDKAAFYIISGLFVVNWIALVAKREETNAIMNRVTDAFSQWAFADPHSRAVLIGLAGLFVLLNVGPTVVYYIRKFWVYPKASMNLQAYLPRMRNSTRTPRAFYVHVGHPVTGKALPVEVSEDWYMHLEAGHRIHAHYHPSSDNVLYLIK
jgi:hypothetical protein